MISERNNLVYFSGNLCIINRKSKKNYIVVSFIKRGSPWMKQKCGETQKLAVTADCTVGHFWRLVDKCHGEQDWLLKDVEKI